LRSLPSSLEFRRRRRSHRNLKPLSLYVPTARTRFTVALATAILIAPSIIAVGSCIVLALGGGLVLIRISIERLSQGNQPLTWQEFGTASMYATIAFCAVLGLVALIRFLPVLLAFLKRSPLDCDRAKQQLRSSFLFGIVPVICMTFVATVIAVDGATKWFGYLAATYGSGIPIILVLLHLWWLLSHPSRPPVLEPSR
jgi:hypothetical protein